MNRKIKKSIIVIAAFLSLVHPFAVANAVKEEDLTRFAENNILYYDNECDPKTTTTDGVDDGTRYIGDGDEHGHWDGKCSNVSSYDNWLSEQYDTVTKVAKAKGLPWEAMLAQAIRESSGFKHEACSYNGLGLKAYSGQASCDGTYAQFNNYGEMWEYYVEHIAPVRNAKNKYPSDPYSYIEYLEYSNKNLVYCGGKDKNGKEECPTYVQDVSAVICSIQKWAESNNKKTSAVTYANWKNSGSSSSSGDSSGSSSGTGSYYKGTKYNLSKEQLRGLTSVAIHENSGSDNALRTQASQMANLFELKSKSSNRWGSGADGLVNYVRNGKWYGAASYYTKTSGVTDAQMKITEDVWKNGNRNIPKNVVEHVTLGSRWIDQLTVNGKTITNSKEIENRSNYIRDKTTIKQSSAVGGGSFVFWAWADDDKKTGDPFGYYTGSTSGADGAEMTTGGGGNPVCPDEDDGEEDSSERIISAALSYAWPYQSSDGSDKDGKCDPGDGKLVDYDGKYDDSICRDNAKPAYKKDVLNPSEITACNVYVATVMRKSGVDSEYETGDTTSQKKYLEKEAEKDDGKWEKVTGDPQPGDVGIKDGHTAIYIGKSGGKWGVMAQASHHNSVPVIGPSSKTTARTDLTYYHRKSSASTCKFNSKNAEGCILYCQGGGESWAGEKYGKGSSCGTFSQGGCGPTSLAMVIANLTGDAKVTPKTVGAEAWDAGARSTCSGSIGEKLITVVKKHGLTYDEKKVAWSVDAINKALDEGKVIQVSANGSAPFSSSGHYISIRGKTSDGKWLLFNSAGGCQKGSWTSSKTAYTPSSVISAAKSVNSGPYAVYK